MSTFSIVIGWFAACRIAALIVVPPVWFGWNSLRRLLIEGPLALQHHRPVGREIVAVMQVVGLEIGAVERRVAPPAIPGPGPSTTPRPRPGGNCWSGR